jgi:hypothetical protein
MQCLVVLLALAVPRVVLFFIWLLTNWILQAFGGNWIWPILGFIFMPYTTLAYMGAMLNGGGVHGLWLVIVIVAAVVDLGHLGFGARGRRRA